METQRKVYTPTEIRQIFQISRPTFTDWCKKGILKKISIPGARRVFITVDSVDALLEQRTPRVHTR